MFSRFSFLIISKLPTRGQPGGWGTADHGLTDSVASTTRVNSLLPNVDVESLYIQMEVYFQEDSLLSGLDSKVQSGITSRLNSNKTLLIVKFLIRYPEFSRY